MGKKGRIGLAIMSMSLLLVTVSINLLLLYVGLEGQEIWQCIDEAIFFTSSIIMCISVIALFIEACVLDIFNPLIDLMVFIYLMMWLLSCVAVITSDYALYWVNLGLVVAGFLLLTIFTMCITACYMDHKYRMEQVKNHVETRVIKGGEPDCYRIPLADIVTPRSSRYK